ncbi:MAG: MFS transporter [bacterium]
MHDINRDDTPTSITAERSLFRNPAFRSLWLVGTIAATARWLEMLVIGIFVFEVTNSPFLVALMLFLRLLPMALFGIFGGIVADRYDRRSVLIAVMSVMTLIAGTLGALALNGLVEVWHVGLCALASGLIWVSDFPVRRTLLSELAGPGQTGTAMSLDILSGSGSRMLGPVLGGGLYTAFGLGGAFILTTTAYAICILFLWRLKHRDDKKQEVHGSVITNVVEGFRGLRQNPTLVGIFVVTVVFNIWGFPFMSMLPVLGKEVLMLDPFSVGVLVSTEGVGAFLGASALAIFGQVRWYRYLYLISVMIYLFMALAFANSTLWWLSAFLLLVAGGSVAVFAAMQSALVLLNSDDATRGRMMGVLSMCIGTGLVGFLHLGLLAGWLGAPMACSVIAIEGVLALFFVARRWPGLLTWQDVDNPS